MVETPSILIIDDEQGLRLTLAQILKKAGYTVETAGSGKEGVRQLQTTPYQLVFLDMKMPGEQGIDLVPVIRSIRPGIPILILTAYPSMETAVPAIQYQVNDYLTKPVDPRKILKKVGEILDAQGNGFTVTAVEELRQGEIPDGKVWVVSPAEEEVVYSVEAPGILISGSLSADVFTNYVKYNNRIVQLPRTAFWYLAVLMRRSPEPTTYVDLVREAEGRQVPPEEAVRIARKNIAMIRKSLDVPNTRQSVIRLCPGKGYFLAVQS